jgi:hypothetical protein
MKVTVVVSNTIKSIASKEVYYKKQVSSFSFGTETAVSAASWEHEKDPINLLWLAGIVSTAGVGRWSHQKKKSSENGGRRKKKRREIWSITELVGINLVICIYIHKVV